MLMLMLLLMQMLMLMLMQLQRQEVGLKCATRDPRVLQPLAALAADPRSKFCIFEVHKQKRLKCSWRWQRQRQQHDDDDDHYVAVEGNALS